MLKEIEKPLLYRRKEGLLEIAWEELVVVVVVELVRMDLGVGRGLDLRGFLLGPCGGGTGPRPGPKPKSTLLLPRPIRVMALISSNRCRFFTPSFI